MGKAALGDVPTWLYAASLIKTHGNRPPSPKVRASARITALPWVLIKRGLILAGGGGERGDHDTAARSLDPAGPEMDVVGSKFEDVEKEGHGDAEEGSYGRI
jgi:hypothetical protein